MRLMKIEIFVELVHDLVPLRIYKKHNHLAIQILAIGDFNSIRFLERFTKYPQQY